MKSHENAFTLLELLAVITVIAIGSIIMPPSMKMLLDRAQLENQKDILISHIQAARTHAVKHAVLTELCGSSDGWQCDGNWQTGWLVREQATAKVLLQYSVRSVKLQWDGFSPEIIFRANGTAPRGNGRFFLCKGAERPAWELVLNRQGRLRSRQEPRTTNC